jgi:hypothetical protein
VELGGAIHCITLGLRLPPRDGNGVLPHKRQRHATAPRDRPKGG